MWVGGFQNKIAVRICLDHTVRHSGPVILAPTIQAQGLNVANVGLNGLT